MLTPMGLPFEFPEGGPHVSNPIRTPEDVDRLVEVNPEKDLSFVFEGIRKITKILPDTPLIGFAGSPFTLACYMIEGMGSKSFDEPRRFLHEFPEAGDRLINFVAENVGRFLKEQIDAYIAADETLLFSAHSLPQRFVDEGDPYIQQVEMSVAMAAGDREYFLSYQSRTGPVKWVGPNTIVEAKRLLCDSRRKLFVAPLSFVCDNIETLYEIDIDLKEKLGADGLRMRRMPMFNGDPKFAEVLAGIVKRKAGLHDVG